GGAVTRRGERSDAVRRGRGDTLTNSFLLKTPCRRDSPALPPRVSAAPHPASLHCPFALRPFSHLGSFSTRLSIKNSIIPSSRKPECPLSGPTWTSKLLLAFFSACMRRI